MSDEPTTSTPDSADSSRGIAHGELALGSNVVPADAITPETSAPKFADVVPESYRDKPYMQNVKDFDSLFKNYDDLQKLRGRPAIPPKDADSATWDEFRKQLRSARPEEFGIPERLEDYKVSMPEEIPDGLKGSEEMLGEFKQFAFENGISPAVAQKLIEFDVGRQKKMYEGYQAAQEEELRQRNVDFEDLGLKHFGNEAERDKVMALGKEYLSKYAPPDFHETIDNLDNKSLLALASVINGMHKDFVKEDKQISTDATGAGNFTPPVTKEELRAQAQKIMRSPAYRNPLDAGHIEARAAIDKIYKDMEVVVNRR